MVGVCGILYLVSLSTTYAIFSFKENSCLTTEESQLEEDAYLFLWERGLPYHTKHLSSSPTQRCLPHGAYIPHTPTVACRSYKRSIPFSPQVANQDVKWTWTKWRREPLLPFFCWVQGVPGKFGLASWWWAPSWYGIVDSVEKNRINWNVVVADGWVHSSV